MDSIKTSKQDAQTRSAKMGRLELVPRNLAGLPSLLMRRLYHHPKMLRRTLTTAERTRVGRSADVAVDYLESTVWGSQERVVNISLDAVLMAAPPAAVAKTLNAIAPAAGLANPALCKLRAPKGIRKYVGAPDFVLWDATSRALLLGEIKIGATSSNGRYSCDQLRKYMLLGLLGYASLGAKHVAHVVILPTDEVEKHCSDADYWVPAVENGRLVERANRFLTYMVEYGMTAGHLSRHLDPLDVGVVRQHLRQETPLIPIDTYVASWAAFCDKLAIACGDQGAEHLASSISALRRLGEGRLASIDGQSLQC